MLEPVLRWSDGRSRPVYEVGCSSCTMTLEIPKPRLKRPAGKEGIDEEVDARVVERALLTAGWRFKPGFRHPVCPVCQGDEMNRKVIELHPVRADPDHLFITALSAAVHEMGEAPDPDLKLPPEITKVVRADQVFDRFWASRRAEGIHHDRAKKEFQRAGERLLASGFIGRLKPHVWLIPGEPEPLHPEQPTETEMTADPRSPKLIPSDVVAVPAEIAPPPFTPAPGEPTAQVYVAPPVRPTTQPTRAQRQKIAAALDGLYDLERGRYFRDGSDAMIAKDLDVPRAWVAEIRGLLYGEDRNETGDARAREFAKLEQRIDDVEKAAWAAIEKLQKQIDAIKAAVATMKAEPK
jgi:hypothetical protein